MGAIVHGAARIADRRRPSGTRTRDGIASTYVMARARASRRLLLLDWNCSKVFGCAPKSACARTLVAHTMYGCGLRTIAQTSGPLRQNGAGDRIADLFTSATRSSQTPQDRRSARERALSS